MRIECPECDELVEVESFACALGPDRVSFYCPTCDEEVTVESDDEDDEDAGDGTGDGDGDKAPDGEVRSPAPALALAVAPALESDGGVSEAVLGQLWELVTDDFSEGARHDAFIAACEAQNKLAFAAARYREWIADHPEDELAAKRQKQLLALAQVRALAVSSRESQRKDPLRKALTAFLVMVVLLVLVIGAAPILLRSARSCRATGPDPAALRKPTLPMVNNLRRRSNMGNYRGLTPRRHRRPASQLRNLKPVGPMLRAPMRPPPTSPAPKPTAPRRSVPGPR